jgi:hypothetical protein
MMSRLFAAIGAVLTLCGSLAAAQVDEPIALGDRRELFVDDFLIDSMTHVTLKPHQPVRREVAITFDRPWEGNGGGYTTVFQDGDLYRMYYHAWQIPGSDPRFPPHPLVIAYAESPDGVTWTRPNLGLFDFGGSTQNNIVLNDIQGSECHDLSPFIDANPKAAPEGKYKAVGFAHGIEPRGLWAFQSPDGIRWSPMQDGPVYTQGVFDTQNIAFWSEQEWQYVLYYRVFVDGVRHIERAVSDDFLHWTREGLLEFDGGGPTQSEQFYVNQIKPYYRAPHILIGFPARYCDRGLTASTFQLPEPEHRRTRIATSQRYGTAVTDSILITSRDGKTFRRIDEPFLTPGLRTRYNWSYGDNYIAWHVVETAPTEDDMPREMSLYATEAYFTEDFSRMRRYTLRLDGFVSAHANREPGELITKPFTFDGSRLSINFGTSAAGYVKVDLQTPDGDAIPGFSEADADVRYGDSLDRTVSWNGSADVAAWAGKPLRMRLTMMEADVYSWKFEK